MKIIIYGTGQIGNVVTQILKDSGHEVVGYVDDNSALHSKKINGQKVYGSGSWLLKKKNGYDRVCLAVGTISSRKKILSWLISKNIKVISAIHPSVIISSDAKVGKGLIIGANSVVYGNTKICSGTFIGPSVTISHDTIIGKYCLISVGSVIGARVIIKNEVFVGSGTVITPKKLSSDSIIKVKKNSIIGAGSLVIEDVKIRDKIAGVPAKSLILKKNIKSKRRL